MDILKSIGFFILALLTAFIGAANGLEGLISIPAFILCMVKGLNHFKIGINEWMLEQDQKWLEKQINNKD